MKNCKCGKQIRNRNNRCMKCETMFRKEHPEICSNYIDGRTLKKYYCNCGNEVSYDSIRHDKKSCKECYIKKLNLNQEAQNNRNYKNGQTLKDYFCIDCNVPISGYEALRCRSCNAKNKFQNPKNHPRFGHNQKPKWEEYNGNWFRSSWEVLYAKYLDKNKVKWLYESKTFDLGDTTYTPDFYLPETNEYIEIKGYISDLFIKKFNLFKEKYNEIKITIIDSKYFKKENNIWQLIQA